MSSKVNLAPVALRQTFKHLLDHAATTFGIAAIMCLPLAFLGVYTAVRPTLAANLLQSLVRGAVGIWLGYATVLAIGTYVQDRDPGVLVLIRRSLSGGLLRYFFTLMAVGAVLAFAALLVLTPLFITVGSVAAGALASGRMPEGGGPVIVFGLVSLPLLVGALMILFLKLGLSTAASALEGTGPFPSLRRSWQATKGRVFDFFLLQSMAFGIAIVIFLVVLGPRTLVTMPALVDPGITDPFRFGSGAPLGPAAAMVAGISTYLGAVLLTPLTAALLANFFLLVRSPPPAAVAPRGRMVPLRQRGTVPTTPPGPPAPVEPPEPEPEEPETPERSPGPSRHGASLRWPPEPRE